MASGQSPIANPLSYWGAIKSLAAQGADTQAFFASVSSAMEARGETFGPKGAAAFSALRGQATQMAAANRALAAAPSVYAIEASMIGTVPYGATARGQSGRPRYDARINYRVRVNGEIVTRTFVNQDIDPSTMTIGQLRAQAYGAAVDAAAGYEEDMVDEPDISLEQW